MRGTARMRVFGASCYARDDGGSRIGKQKSHTEMTDMYSGRGGRDFGGSGGMGGEGGPKPVKVGDEIDVVIEAMAARGDGLAKKDGFVIFVKGTTMGQNVRIKVTDVRERFAVGEVLGEATGAPTPASIPAADAPADETAPEEAAQAGEESPSE